MKADRNDFERSKYGTPAGETLRWLVFCILLACAPAIVIAAYRWAI